jgi:membrane protein YqaA with SNARE-associated domain
MEEFLASYGGPGLLLVAFVAATLVPISSEAAVITVIALGMPSTDVLVWASVGNCLGVSANYALGWMGRTRVIEGRASRGSKLERFTRWLDRYGKWSLFLSWLPVVGDPMTIAAGLARVNLIFFIVVAFGVRVARYWLLIEAMR